MTKVIIDLTSDVFLDPPEHQRVFLRPPGSDIGEIVRPGDRYLSVDTSRLDEACLRRLGTAVLREYVPTEIRVGSEDGWRPGSILGDELGLPVLTVRRNHPPAVPSAPAQVQAHATGQRPRTLVLNRRSLQSLFDGATCRLPVDKVDLYLITHGYGGTTGLPPQIIPHSFVVNIMNLTEVYSISEWLVKEHGVTHISALQEKSVALAAGVREVGGLFGTPPEVAQGFRDKVIMKARAAAAGIKIPRFQPIDSVADFDRIDVDASRWVLKPRAEQGAAGVRVFETLAQCREAWLLGSRHPAEFEVEEFIDGQIYHCDAVFTGGHMRFARSSCYVGVPGKFAPGGFLASYLMPESPLTRRMHQFTSDVVNALRLTDGVVHLELFHTPDDELVLLEVASRPAGGLIPQAIKRSTGVDLITAQVCADSGLGWHTDHSVPAQDGIWGWVGVFFRPDVPPRSVDRDGLGIVETWPGSARDRPPAHCTDYDDGYVLRADTVEEWRRNLADLTS
jgi:hypothetical protein